MCRSAFPVERAMRRNRILIIDDEQSLLESLEMFLTEAGYKVQCAASAREGLEKSRAFKPDVVILDIRLPDSDGFDVLQELRGVSKACPVIMITAFHDMDTTIRTVKLGAFEYIPKPIDVDELERAITKALKLNRTSPLRESLSLDTSLPYREGQIVGKSLAMKEIFKAVGRLSENQVTVLIEGETGTGKEVVAKAIHRNSPHKEQPFVAINCSTIVGTLLESELFGHEKGSFTGASYTKKGKFELAERGTIFLDEVGEIPLDLQSKLLRFLQEKEFERIGGEKKLKSNARVIAATNRELWSMVRAGQFREDLYYRLSVATVKLPSLRERKEDIPLLIDFLVRRINHELKMALRRVERRAVDRLTDYDWPGNVRELENVLTRAAIETQGDVITEEMVTPLLGKKALTAALQKRDAKETSLEEFEREYILGVLERTQWHLGKACELLGISRPTLRERLKSYHITRETDTSGR
jgi:two-component system response regulator AtoC